MGETPARDRGATEDGGSRRRRQRLVEIRERPPGPAVNSPLVVRRDERAPPGVGQTQRRAAGADRRAQLERDPVTTGAQRVARIVDVDRRGCPVARGSDATAVQPHDVLGIGGDLESATLERRGDVEVAGEEERPRLDLARLGCDPDPEPLRRTESHEAREPPPTLGGDAQSEQQDESNGGAPARGETVRHGRRKLAQRSPPEARPTARSLTLARASL
jgi:hypothetical protein